MATKRSDPPRARTARPPRAALAAIGLVAIAAVAAWWWFRSPSFTLDVNPDRNVLLVSIDTLRADALGSYGGRAETPNLDRLAARGARFTFAHGHAVVTLASHASLLTGRYPYEHGIRDNTGYRLAPAQPTAASRLRAQGFATGAFVGGFPLDHRFGLSAGFDVYDDKMGQASLADSNDRERRADAVVAAAIDWIGRQSGKWFAFVHAYDPHEPYQPPADWAARFPSDPYLGEVSWTDFALGPLIDRLATLPRPTVVVVTADHGESLGEHGERTHSLFAYEATLHVPLILSEVAGGGPSALLGASRAKSRDGPRVAGAKGVVIDAPVRHVDVLPTLLDAVGVAADNALSGRSLRELIGTRGDGDRPSYFEAMTATLQRGWAPLRGVLVGREKYIDLPIAELYDLAADPRESQNLLPAQRARGEFMVNTLRGFDMTPPGRPREETPDSLERLRALGYIGGGSAAPREKYTEEDDPKRLISLEQTLHQAVEASRQGRFDEAVGLFKSVIARRPDTEDAYRQLAFLYWSAGRPAEAIAILEDAIRHGVTQREVRIKLGEYLSQAGQAPKAIALLQSFADDDPDALIALGNAFLLAERQAEAQRTFRHLIDLDPQNALAYENLGAAQAKAGDYKAAETSLRRAIALDASLAGAYTVLGVVYASTWRTAEAIDAWKRAVDLDASDFDALFNLTKTLVEAGRRDEAQAYGDRFIRTAPPSLQQDVAVIRKLLGK